MRLLIALWAASAAAQQLTYLDNGSIRIGVDLELGGSITYLAAAGQENMINSADYGRQIQQSYYSGPAPFGRPHPSWPNWPWNPISTGDVYRNRSRLLKYSNDGTTLYVRAAPLQWALDNVACECTFETWIELDHNIARVRARLNNLRPDRSQYPARDQELPAVYTNGPFHHLFTYDGLEPFTKAPVREIVNSGPPWANWQATENWAALVNDDGFGLGVFHPGVFRFIGGFHGTRGVGGPKDNPTGYISPVRREILDHDIRYSYEYQLIVGSADQIRDYAYANRPDPRPEYIFRRDRQHWTYTNASDTGWPVRGRLRIGVEGEDPYLTGPPGLWRAEEVAKLYIRAAHRTKQDRAELFWSVPGQGFSAVRRLPFDVITDGRYHTYEIDMASSPEWRGWITGLRLDPVASGSPGEFVDVKYISWRER
ncbi:MAG: hypothetical protein HY235_05520 [Acidobacteria bacterium]|nr:hypothetical protein [Acidobacteriota bacterium]